MNFRTITCRKSGFSKIRSKHCQTIHIAEIQKLIKTLDKILTFHFTNFASGIGQHNHTFCLFSLCKGVSVHTDLSPRFTSLLRNFRGPRPSKKYNVRQCMREWKRLMKW